MRRLFALLALACCLTMPSDAARGAYKISAAGHTPPRAWFSSANGHTFTLAMDEPDLHQTRPAIEQRAIAAAGHARPVAVTFYSPGCRVDRKYLRGLDVYVDDAYFGFQNLPIDVVSATRGEVRDCLRRLAPFHLEYVVTLQAFGPNLAGNSPLDRWRCLSRHELAGSIAAARPAAAILFFDRAYACPNLAPLIEREIT